MVGDNWETSENKWETKVKLCGQRMPSVVGGKRRQVGDKGKIMRAEYPVQSLVENRWETGGDRRETKVKSCGQSIYSLVGGTRRRAETSGRQREKYAHSEVSWKQVGDKGREVGDKGKIIQGDTRRQAETSGRQG